MEAGRKICEAQCKTLKRDEKMNVMQYSTIELDKMKTSKPLKIENMPVKLLRIEVHLPKSVRNG